MKEFNVSVGADHINAIARARKPLLGIAELIWNALDADANARTGSSSLPMSFGGVETIVVEGQWGRAYLPMSWSEPSVNWATPGSGKLQRRGLSVERFMVRRVSDATAHLGLGDSVLWETRYIDQGSTFAYDIEFDSSDKRKVRATDPVPSAEGVGTRVTIHNITARYEALSIEAGPCRDH